MTAGISFVLSPAVVNLFVGGVKYISGREENALWQVFHLPPFRR
jgi:hypothetical protein